MSGIRGLAKFGEIVAAFSNVLFAPAGHDVKLNK